MIAEVIPQAYDSLGKQVSQPFHGRKRLHPTFPMGRFVSRPLTHPCKSIEEIRQFLCGCRARSDEELFGKEEYWQPPDEFEQRKAGDCEDFSFWTWRQLLAMGLDARLVFGRHGRYGTGHAWVEFFQDGKCYLVEPQARYLGQVLPRLSTLQYAPTYSTAWDGKTLRYYSHSKPTVSRPTFRFLLSLLPEWIGIWGWQWMRLAVRLPYRLTARLLRRARNEGTSP